jgi:hypothetical protein
MEYLTHTAPLIAIAFVLGFIAYVVWSIFQEARATRKFEKEMSEMRAEDAELHRRRVVNPYAD